MPLSRSLNRQGNTRLSRRLLCLLGVLLLCSCSSQPDKAIDELQIATPRPYGYVIGDEIPQHIEFDINHEAQLQTDALPVQGAINYWLDLKKVTWQKTEINQGWHYQIDLLYQVFYAPLEVKMLKIPGFQLQILADGKVSSQAVPDWSFTIAPLRELAVRKTAMGEYMRPDAKPDLLTDRSLSIFLGVSILATLLIGLYLIYCYGLLPLTKRRKIFKFAWQQLAKLDKQDMGTMLHILHQAFNQVYGAALFEYSLADFFAKHAEYRGLHKQLLWFFHYSNRYHFGDGMIVVADDVQQLKDLCLQCRGIERGSQ